MMAMDVEKELKLIMMYKRIDNYNLVFNNEHYCDGVMVGFSLGGRTYGIVKTFRKLDYGNGNAVESLHMGVNGIDRQLIIAGEYPKRVEGILIEYV